ncbi:MAG: methyl-accepting chemotaxis protein [Bradymonadia bacterium]
MKRQLSLKGRITWLIIGAGLVGTVLSGLIGYSTATSAAIEQAEAHLDTVGKARQKQLKDYLKAIENELLINADSPLIKQAINEFGAAWQKLEGPEKTLQRLYITENPNPTGKKEELDFAPDGSEYSAVHQRLHPWFRNLLRTQGYYDIFLFNTEGDLIYTVFKELDYATNMNTGEWKDTDLANVFRGAFESGQKGAVTFKDFKPYGPSHGAPASFISTPVIGADGKPIGVLAFQMPIDRLNSIMADTNGLGETGRSLIVGADYMLRNQDRLTKEPTILKTKMDIEMAKQALNGESGVGCTTIGDTMQKIAYGSFDFHGARWAVLTLQDEAEILAPVTAMTWTLLIGVLVLGGVLNFVGWVAGNRVSTPIVTLTDLMTRLAQADTSIEVPHRDRHDEIGRIAMALDILRQGEQERQNLLAEQEAARVAAAQERDRVLEKMATFIHGQTESAVSGIAETTEMMCSVATDLVGTSTRVQGDAQAVAAAAQQTLANTETVAASAEELSASITEISSQVNHAARTAAGASDQARNTQDVVQSLKAAADQAGEVVSLISEIAEQTNLLALNATIEAARAGDAGKGFAVVADEVKSLANQTASSTEQIAHQLQSMNNITQEAVEAINQIASTIDEVNQINTSIAAAVEEQSAATNEIARNVGQAAAGSREVTDRISQVSSEASAVADTAEAFDMSAKMLEEQMVILKDQINTSVRDSVAQAHS